LKVVWAIISASNEEEVAFVGTLPYLQEKYKGVWRRKRR
jgi:hypothetical protein